MALVTVLSAVATFVSWGLLAEASAAHPEREPLFLTLAALDPILGIAAIVLFTRVLRREDDDAARRRAVGAAVGAIALSSISGAAIVPAAGSSSRSRAAAWSWDRPGRRPRSCWVAAAVNLWLVQPAPRVGRRAVMGLIAVPCADRPVPGQPAGPGAVRCAKRRKPPGRARRPPPAPGRRSGPGSPARCTTRSLTTSHSSRCTPGPWSTARTSTPPAPGSPQPSSGAPPRRPAEELRTVLTVLREDPADTTPAPSFDRLETLVDDVRTRRHASLAARRRRPGAPGGRHRPRGPGGAGGPDQRGAARARPRRRRRRHGHAHEGRSR